MAAVEYREGAPRKGVAGQPLSHVSIEAGHIYMADVADDSDRIRRHFERVAPLVEAYRRTAILEFGKGARVSTCFLIDDYFGSESRPADILAKLLGVAGECGVTIDYLVRQAGCAETPVFVEGEPTGDPIRLAEMVAARIVAEPEQGESTGRRAATSESGWLCNGLRSSDNAVAQAMRVEPYRPPEEFGARRHSIFLDVQLWDRWTESIDGAPVERVRWSDPFLRAIWQLLRLGLIRYEGAVVAAPRDLPESWPEHWRGLAAVTRLNPRAAPFAAYHALSILPTDHLAVDHAVRVVLDHLRLDREVVGQLVERAAAENITLPDDVNRRITHVLLGDV
ncbi:SCO2522 family protein [Nocardia sp. NPDC052001]|uniref:SCO2522 family protein n=1 Tax=Nocardia sp. NPDC052001 TaxID=3154853 RepID=UPI00343D6133